MVAMRCIKPCSSRSRTICPECQSAGLLMNWRVNIAKPLNRAG